MAYATVTNVSTSLGRPITSIEEVSQVLQWLDDAEMLIQARLGDLSALIIAGTLSQQSLVYVEREAVVRKVKNPDGKQNEKIDDYSYGLNEDARRGDIFVTDEEWALLAPSAGGASFTIRAAATPGYRTDSAGLDWT